MQSLVRVTAPTTEPVTTDEAMAFLRVDNEDESLLIDGLITAAREVVEDFTGRAMISQTWKYSGPSWPLGKYYGSIYACAFELNRSPLISVQSVKYYPASGAAQATLSSDTYHVLTGPAPGMVVLKTTESWPDLYDRPDAVEVNFTAGCASAAAIPRVQRQAVLLTLSHLYENRGAINIGNIVNELPFSLKFLLETQRVGGWVA